MTNSNPHSDKQFVQRYAEKRRRSKTTRNRRQQELGYILDALHRAGISSAASGLDLPSGTGWLSQELVDRGHQMVPADLAIPMLEVLQEDHPALKDRAVCCNVKALPFADNSFDFALSVRLFHHLATSEDRVAALSELTRVAKKGVVISFFHSWSIRAVINYLRGITGEISGRYCISLATLRREVEDLGWEVKRTYSPLKYLRRNWFALLVPKE